MEYIDDAAVSRAYAVALDRGLIGADDTAVIFIDLRVLEDRLNCLREAFPAGTLHAIAVKTNPLGPVLRHIVDGGMGLEAASFGEVMLAVRAGAAAERIVFDSPAKTHEEIDYLRNHLPGMRVNADSLAELARYPKQGSGLRLGLRINPLVSAGSVASMTVSTADSKFGVPIVERDEITAACLANEDLDCLHLHVGSQYARLEPAVDAVRKVIDLAAHINAVAGTRRITTIDMGGGFPVNYEDGEEYVVSAYAELLREQCPELFDGAYQLITEFGRFVHANACWAASRIEYVKAKHDGAILISHAGADMFLREAYNPGDWAHRIHLLDASGRPKSGNALTTDVAGPLCFGGDFVARDIELPAAEEGDVLAIRDIGANTFSLWSRHCSRPFPKVIAMDGQDDSAMRVIKERESWEQIAEFWG